mgnify:CR=1 FL=1
MSAPCRPPKFPPAPSDAACEQAWGQIMKLAEEHCLIVQAYGGVATLAVPEEQRKQGVRAVVLQAHCKSESEEVQA